MINTLNDWFTTILVIVIVICGFFITRLLMERILDAIVSLVKQYLFQARGIQFTFLQDDVDMIAKELTTMIYIFLIVAIVLHTFITMYWYGIPVS